jgi:hypothetical protein
MSINVCLCLLHIQTFRLRLNKLGRMLFQYHSSLANYDILSQLKLV